MPRIERIHFNEKDTVAEFSDGKKMGVGNGAIKSKDDFVRILRDSLRRQDVSNAIKTEIRTLEKTDVNP